MTLYRRHERFSKEAAKDLQLQIQIELQRRRERDFALDCLDMVEGRQTEGARRAAAERDRLLRLASEAKRRALVGADPLNITKHTKGKPPRQRLAADPVEYVGHIARARTAIDRLTGKNKLDPRQVMAADTYRTAFETIHSTLGGTMDFSRVRGGSSGSRAPAEAMLVASQTLKRAKEVMGVRATIIVEQIVCHGRTAEQCARLVYSYSEGQTIATRDIEYVGRALREALTELGMMWQPEPRRRRVQGIRAPRDEVTTGGAGVRAIDGVPHIG